MREGGAAQALATYSRVAAVERCLINFANMASNHYSGLDSRLKCVNCNTQRMALQPAFKLGPSIGVRRVVVEEEVNKGSTDEEDGDGSGARYEATLSKCPRDVYSLWIEYKMGL